MWFIKIYSITIHMINIYMYIKHFTHFTIVCMPIYMVNSKCIRLSLYLHVYHLQYTF